MCSSMQTGPPREAQGRRVQYGWDKQRRALEPPHRYNPRYRMPLEQLPHKAPRIDPQTRLCGYRSRTIDQRGIADDHFGVAKESKHGQAIAGRTSPIFSEMQSCFIQETAKLLLQGGGELGMSRYEPPTMSEKPTRRSARSAHSDRLRSWRHLDFFQFEAWLQPTCRALRAAAATHFRKMGTLIDIDPSDHPDRTNHSSPRLMHIVTSA